MRTVTTTITTTIDVDQRDFTFSPCSPMRVLQCLRTLKYIIYIYVAVCVYEYVCAYARCTPMRSGWSDWFDSRGRWHEHEYWVRYMTSFNGYQSID